MIKQTDNYMEAKRIILNSVNDEYSKAYIKSVKRRTVCLTLLCVGFGAVMGLYTHDLYVALGVIPFSLVGIICSYIPVILHRKNEKLIKDGTFFKGKSHHEIIRIANEYAETYSEFERKRTKGASSG